MPVPDCGVLILASITGYTQKPDFHATMFLLFFIYFLLATSFGPEKKVRGAAFGPRAAS